MSMDHPSLGGGHLRMIPTKPLRRKVKKNRFDYTLAQNFLVDLGDIYPPKIPSQIEKTYYRR